VSRDQIIVAAFLLGTLIYTFGPDVVRRIVTRRPERLAPYSRYQDLDL
jgi:hypothetical protein